METAIKINPGHADVYENRRIANKSLGDKEKACSDWKRTYIKSKLFLKRLDLA
jgi:hypothetical protein